MVRASDSEMLGILREDMKLRATELEIRRDETKIKEKQVDHAAKFSEKSLEAQANDLKHERDHRARERTKTLVFGGIALLVVVLFVGYCVYIGKDQFVMELAKVLGGFVAGGASGYGYAVTRRKPARTRSASDDDDDDRA